MCHPRGSGNQERAAQTCGPLEAGQGGAAYLPATITLLDWPEVLPAASKATTQ